MSRFPYALAALLLFCVVSCAPAPKWSISDWGSPVNPDKDCKFRSNRGVLTIEMPGTVHDYDFQAKNASTNDLRGLSPPPPPAAPKAGGPPRQARRPANLGSYSGTGSKRLNAPRIMREFEGDFELQVRVRIDCRASTESSVNGQPSYVSAGFLVLLPDESYSILRSEYKVEGQGDGVDGSVSYESLGTSGGIPLKQHPKWPFEGKPDYVYQRLERWDGGAVAYSFSSDGKKWIPMGASCPLEKHSKVRVGLLACSTSTAPSPDRFDQLKIIPPKKRDPWEFTSGWSKPENPDKDCKIQREKDSLTIEMPGSDHDYDPARKRFNAPRLISDLEGDFDLQVRVRIDYRPSAQSTVKGQPSFVSAGFLLIYPQDIELPYGLDICARSEYAVSQHGSKPDGYAVAPRLAQPRRENPAAKEMAADGFALAKEWHVGLLRKNNRVEWDRGIPPRLRTDIWERGWQNWPLAEKAEYAYLRLYHRESGACFYISPDGEKWTWLTTLSSLPEKGKLALAAYSTSTEPSKVRFDQLKLRRGEKKQQE